MSTPSPASHASSPHPPHQGLPSLAWRLTPLQPPWCSASCSFSRTLPRAQMLHRRLAPSSPSPPQMSSAQPLFLLLSSSFSQLPLSAFLQEGHSCSHGRHKQRLALPPLQPWPRLRSSDDRPRRHRQPQLTAASFKFAASSPCLDSSCVDPFALAPFPRDPAGRSPVAATLLLPVAMAVGLYFPALRVRSGVVRIRSTTSVCLLHELVLLPIGISVAGADDTSAGDATELRWELNEDLGRCYVSFHVDQ